MYVRTTHDEELTGRSVVTNAYYLDFSARRVIWAGFAGLGFASFMSAVVVALPPAPFLLKI